MMANPRNQTYYYNQLVRVEMTPEDWQTKIRKGDYYEIASECISDCIPKIYGVILEPFREIGFYRVWAYSAWCPGGEEGTLCIVEPTRILTRQEFEYARTRSWQIEEQMMEADIQ